MAPSLTMVSRAFTYVPRDYPKIEIVLIAYGNTEWKESVHVDMYRYIAMQCIAILKD